MHADGAINPLKFMHACQLSVAGLKKLKFDKIVPLYKTMTIGSRLDCFCQVMDALGKLLSTQKPRDDSYACLVLNILSLLIIMIIIIMMIIIISVC